MLDLKVNYKNKYKHDLTCRICRVEDIFKCKAYEKELNLESDFSPLWISSDDLDKISKTVEIIENILNARENTSRKKKRNVEC